MMRRFGWLAAAALLSTCMAFQAQAGGKADKDQLQGTWDLVSVSIQGKDLPAPPGKEKTLSLIFKGDKVTKSEGGKDEAADFKLDASKTPKEIDIVTSKETMKALYEVKGDTLKLAFGLKGPTERPTAFTG